MAESPEMRETIVRRPQGKYRSSTISSSVGGSHSELDCRIQKKKEERGGQLARSHSGNHDHLNPPLSSRASSKAEGLQAADNQAQADLSLEQLCEAPLFLQLDLQVSVSDPKKKKASFRSGTARLYAYGLVLEGASKSKKEQMYSLKSLCLIQQEEALAASAGSSSSLPGSPFHLGKARSRRDKASKSTDRTILLCTHNLTRIWLRFSEKNDFLQWILCLDGLLGTFYSSSLLLPLNKTLFLRERYLTAYEGGTIKIGDAEEWSYLGRNGSLTCLLADHDDILKTTFTFDGQYLRSPDEQARSWGEWDGVNVYWYESDHSGGSSQRARHLNAVKRYTWNDSQAEFHLVENNCLVQDSKTVWALTRNFLARKDGMGGDWIQVEGAVPICLAMFLCLFHAQGS